LAKIITHPGYADASHPQHKRPVNEAAWEFERQGGELMESGIVGIKVRV